MRAIHQAAPATILQKKTINFRLAIICMATASVGLSVAFVSIAKLLLLICGLTALLFALRKSEPNRALVGLYTPVAVLVVLFALALSLFWTAAPQAEALSSLGKYGKLLGVVLLVALIRDRREALYGLGAFALAQLFLLASSWSLFAHLPVPWATSYVALTHYSVFSSYLDQGIISATFAAICWHLRGLVPGRFGRHLAIFFALMALCNVLFVLTGRTGHVVAIAWVSVAIMWELPKKYRALAVLLPFLLVLALFFSSTQVRERLLQVKTEVQSYSTQVTATTSSGIRLNLWLRAVQSIEEHPLTGSGIGSWRVEYDRLEREHNPANKDTANNGNPHQEYLLWGVHLGVPGLLLITALMLAILRDTMRMGKPYARAAQSALLAMAVACLFNASIYDALIGDFFCILIGLLLALGITDKSNQEAAAPAYGQVT
jgi:O-antigen ligase